MPIMRQYPPQPQPADPLLQALLPLFAPRTANPVPGVTFAAPAQPVDPWAILQSLFKPPQDIADEAANSMYAKKRKHPNTGVTGGTGNAGAYGIRTFQDRTSSG